MGYFCEAEGIDERYTTAYISREAQMLLRFWGKKRQPFHSLLRKFDEQQLRILKRYGIR